MDSLVSEVTEEQDRCFFCSQALRPEQPPIIGTGA
jgi:hypothetical protein